MADENKLRQIRYYFQLWRARKLSTFLGYLFSTIGKADWENREGLRAGFPIEVSIFEEWERGPRGSFPDHWPKCPGCDKRVKDQILTCGSMHCAEATGA